MTLTVCLGKTGDILNILPLLRTEVMGQMKPSLMVSKDYADVLDGVGYVNPIIFDGPAYEIERAVKQADTMSSAVRVVQVCGPKEQVNKCVLARGPEPRASNFVTDSFQKDMWRLAGRWADFNKGLPLVFDKRDHKREVGLVGMHTTPKKKVLLISTGRGKGWKPSPEMFPYKPLLMLLLERYKRLWQVVDLDDVQAYRFYDLLGLYERASLLITTDSAPLHLAYAVPKLPVVAFVKDQPGMWHGSVWRPNHIFHCRYSDFAARAAEMIYSIDRMGFAGDPFWARKTPGPKFVHVWSQYEVTEENRHRHEAALRTWETRYQTDGNWVSCRIDRGAFGRDTLTEKMDEPHGGIGRYPFLKDVLRAAGHRAKGDDLIVVTRADTCLTTAPLSAGWCRRTMRVAATKDEPAGEVFHPSVDLIAFPKKTLERLAELPDLVMGPDSVWSRVVREWAGVPEIENLTWRMAT